MFQKIKSLWTKKPKSKEDDKCLEYQYKPKPKTTSEDYQEGGKFYNIQTYDTKEN